jgi:hypothetical protein
VGLKETDPSVIQFRGDCLVSKDGGISWVADEGGHFTVVPASKYQSVEVTRPDADPNFCVGFYQNRMDPSWFADDEGDLVPPVDPLEWRYSKYQVLALLDLARPDSEIEPLWSFFRSGPSFEIEVVVGHGSPEARPPNGLIHGGRIFALRLPVLPPWDRWVV